MIASCLVACGTEHASGEGVCDSEALTSALRSAEPGDVVPLGACTVDGEFVVPKGVRLEGRGDRSVLEVGRGAVALRAAPRGMEETALASVTVRSSGNAGVVAIHGRDGDRPTGAVGLRAVRVEVDAGTGIDLRRLAKARLIDVQVRGTIDASNADRVPASPPPDRYSTHGVFASSIPALRAEDLSARGFAVHGVLLGRIDGTWRGGRVSSNLGNGVSIIGPCLVDVVDVTVEETLAGLRSFPTYALRISGGAEVESEGLALLDNQQFGLFQNGGRGHHVGLNAVGNELTAVWGQDATAFEVSGEFEDNDFAAVVAVSNERTTIRDSVATATNRRLWPFGLFGSITVGDGLHIADPRTLRIERTELSRNERAGLLIDLVERPARELSVNATVEATPGAIGAKIQNGEFDPSWDANVRRQGSTRSEDLEADELTSTNEIIGPDDIPDVIVPETLD